jgi:histidine triad (HIT) family protein
MQNCLFCRMVRGEITPQKVFETDEILAFRDISPAAPTHVLIIPKRHVATVNDATPEDAPLLGQLFVAAGRVAAAEGLAADGYRLVVNCNADAGQSVFHVHMHLLGGGPMGWPPFPPRD